MERLTGVVKWFNDSKGYGFIKCEGKKDIFVHFSALKEGGYRTLNDGQKVEFNIVEGQKGPQASEVVVID